MKLIYKLIIANVVVSLCWGKPWYVAIPWENVETMDEIRADALLQHPRLRRHTLNQKTQKHGTYLQRQPVAEESSQFEQQNNFNPHEYVDFGAHTGHHGAFGWYADFPVHTH